MSITVSAPIDKADVPQIPLSPPWCERGRDQRIEQEEKSNVEDGGWRDNWSNQASAGRREAELMNTQIENHYTCAGISQWSQYEPGMEVSVLGWILSPILLVFLIHRRARSWQLISKGAARPENWMKPPDMDSLWFRILLLLHRLSVVSLPWQGISSHEIANYIERSIPG